jgi:hypothetical protein
MKSERSKASAMEVIGGAAKDLDLDLDLQPVESTAATGAGGCQKELGRRTLSRNHLLHARASI